MHLCERIMLSSIAKFSSKNDQKGSYLQERHFEMHVKYSSGKLFGKKSSISSPNLLFRN